LKLRDLPGVGSRIRERLTEHYGGEDAALDAVLKGDVVGLMQVVSERQALSLVKWATGNRYGQTSGEFLATDEAVAIYQSLVSKIAVYTHTDYARLRIGTIFPSSSPELITENRRMASAAIDTARTLDNSGIDDLLRRIKPLRERTLARIRDRALAFMDTEVFMQLKARGLDRLIDLHMAESKRELLDLAGSYSHVTLIGADADSPSGVECAESVEDWYLIPEATLGFYRENLETLSAAVEIARCLQEAGLASFPGLNDYDGLMSRLGRDDDAEVERLSRLLSSLSRSINEIASWANARLKERIESSTITLGGSDLLQFVSRGEGAKELFEIQMRGVFQEVLLEAKAKAASCLQLTGPDSVWLDEIIPSEVCYPLEVNRQALHALEQDLRSRIESRGLRAKRDLARGLADKKQFSRDLVAIIMEFDFAYALGKFCLAEGLNMPVIFEAPCLGFIDGRNLFLDRAEPVSYSLGETGLIEYPERVAILSGVNSGGKTSLLDLIAQIVMLTHMGLPVPAANCRMGIFQEMYYFSKSRGTLSAGAFETAMRKFSVVENDKRKLVLADELEAITEPGASARIIACMLDDLQRLGSVAVFVSHLAEDIKRFAEAPVRVDGIEASGLDENNNLLVSRSPRYNYLARSTPELILDRLARTTDGPQREFYARLLAKFRVMLLYFQYDLILWKSGISFSSAYCSCPPSTWPTTS
jgi:DNA mismatch repair protein MutS2